MEKLSEGVTSGPHGIEPGDELGLESRHLESRAKAEARLDIEVAAGWVIPPSRVLWSGDALLLSTGEGDTVGGHKCVERDG